MTNETWKLMAIFTATLSVIGLSGVRLRIRYASDIRIIFYFFGLSATLTAVIAMFAIYAGGINSKGHFSGTIGTVVSWLLKETLAVDHGIVIFSALAALITAPQIISYILSGFFGVAHKPMFTETSIDLIAFAIIKSATIAAGAIFAASIIGQVQGWEGWSWNGMLAMQAFVLMLLMISFATALYYREANETGFLKAQRLDPNTRNIFVLFHRIMTRKESRQPRGLWDA